MAREKEILIAQNHSAKDDLDFIEHISKYLVILDIFELTGSRCFSSIVRTYCLRPSETVSAGENGAETMASGSFTLRIPSRLSGLIPPFMTSTPP